MRLRLAEPSDAENILEIYKPYILNTRITFEYDVPSAEDFRKRVEKICEKYPYILCERDGRLSGYCYASRFMERAAFGWDAELSVYLREEERGKGIGRVLYCAVIEILGLMNIRNIYGLIAYPNDASERLHRELGFKLQGVLEKTGYKLGEWTDLMYFCLRLDGDDKKEVVPICDIDSEKIGRLLAEYEKKLPK